MDHPISTAKAGRTTYAVVVSAVLVVVIAAVPTALLGPAPTPRFHVYNLDPVFADANNDLVWDPNFEPGFNATPGVNIQWNDPTGGPGSLSYFVGPWANASVAPYPHFSVGPQAFSFHEVPRTQVYRSPSWGDYVDVRQGFLSCAVNLGNYTVDPTAALHPVYIGMAETGVSWYVAMQLHWDAPVLEPGLPADARLELVTTTTLPAVGNSSYPLLVYTELVLWSSSVSVASIAVSPGAEPRLAETGGAVSFAVDQLPNHAVDRSYLIPLSGYIASTLEQLHLTPTGALLSYVYLSAAGYNTHLQLSVSGLWVESPQSLCP